MVTSSLHVPPPQDCLPEILAPRAVRPRSQFEPVVLRTVFWKSSSRNVPLCTVVRVTNVA